MKKLQYFNSLDEARAALRQYDPKQPFSVSRARSLLHRPRPLRQKRARGLFKFRSFDEAREHAMQNMIHDAAGRKP